MKQASTWARDVAERDEGECTEKEQDANESPGGSQANGRAAIKKRILGKAEDARSKNGDSNDGKRCQASVDKELFGQTPSRCRKASVC